MVASSSYFSPRMLGTAAVLGALLVTACTPQSVPPQQVQASTPRVTYKYRGDQELLQANQNAMNYCVQYHAMARTLNITDNSDGGKTAMFECVATGPTVVTTTQQSFVPNTSYIYRSDQDLLDASRNAQIYCMSNGSQRAMSTTVLNPDGTKSVTFQCTAS